MRSVALGALLLSGAAAPALAQQTPAGTNINNVATATFDLPGGGTGTSTSNQVTVRVDELLDVAVASLNSSDVGTTAGATSQVLTFRVTNAGNGDEALRLAALGTGSGDDFDTTVTQIVLDDGDGTFEDPSAPGGDTLYVAGSNDPVLAQGASRTVFVLNTIPAGLADAARALVTLEAEAVTGTGAPGTVFAGQGTGGTDAVVGATGADDIDDGAFVVSAATVALVKSATVLDPFGGTTRVPGAIITYSLSATVSGSGTMNGLRITDPVPSGTAYVPGSIMLGGSGLTDAAGDDAGEIAANVVTVRLGNLPAGSNRVVTFKVRVN